MPEVKQGISLRALADGLMQAAREAKHRGDLESITLSEAYRKDKRLSSLSAPAFAIADLEVELHFAILAVDELPTQGGTIEDVRIAVSPDALRSLQPHQISVMKIKIEPFLLQAYEIT